MRHKKIVRRILLAFSISMILLAFQWKDSNKGFKRSTSQETLKQTYMVYINGLIKNLSLKEIYSSYEDVQVNIEETTTGIPLVILP